MLGVSTWLNRDRLRVVLVAARNPLNIGAAARAMSNFGFSRLRVVNAYQIAWREARSAVGASEVLRTAEEFTTIADAVADCELVVGTSGAAKREVEQPVLRLEQAARKIKGTRGSVALLFGSEKTGLSRDDLSYCHLLLRIPTREGHPSMNLGQAVAVCLFELVRGAPVQASTKPQRAGAANLQRITMFLLDTLRASGYVKARTAVSTEQKVRRLVRRLELTPEDAVVLLGMLRQIAWKLHRKE